jgi:hypothetical protein
MKKTLLTIAIVLGMTLGAVAQKQGGGLFGMGAQRMDNQYMDNRDTPGALIQLPGEHGSTEDQSPLGTGALLLIGFGAAYALKKRKK